MTAALLVAVPFVLILLAMAIGGALAWRRAKREAEEDEYFPPHSFPEIEHDPERISRYLEQGEWPT